MDSTEKQSLKNNLELIKTVHDNCKHVIELEKLENLFLIAKFNSKEEDEIIPKHYGFLLQVVRDTIASHYSENENFLLIDNVLNNLKSIYGNYADDIEFDLLNKFESK